MNHFKIDMTSVLVAVSLSALLTGCGGEKAPSESADVGGVDQANTSSSSATKAPAMPVIDEAKLVKTPSGLQYEEIVVGNGPNPKSGQNVTVHYTGWLKDGKKFDSSVDRGQPFDFVIGQGQVIAGWDEGVGSMKVGGKRNLVIPANLAYGERGAGADIPPNSPLIFQVELLNVK